MARTRKWLSWDMGRADARVVVGLLVALAVLYPAAVLLPPLVRWARGADLVWSTASSVTPPTVTGLGGVDVTATYSDTVVWTLHHASASQWLASLMPALVTWAVLLAGCVLAGRLVQTALSGEPFGVAGPTRLRALALLVMGYGALVPTLHVFADLGVLWRVDSAGVLAWVFDPSATLVPIVIGLVVLVVGECFRIGRTLADDVAGLV